MEEVYQISKNFREFLSVSPEWGKNEGEKELFQKWGKDKKRISKIFKRGKRKKKKGKEEFDKHLANIPRSMENKGARNGGARVCSTHLSAFYGLLVDTSLS